MAGLRQEGHEALDRLDIVGAELERVGEELGEAIRAAEVAEIEWQRCRLLTVIPLADVREGERPVPERAREDRAVSEHFQEWSAYISTRATVQALRAKADSLSSAQSRAQTRVGFIRSELDALHRQGP